jgi:peptidoglycan hydrolase-like protein with peptidoglycan-binding domain
MQHMRKRSFRPALDDLEGRQLLSVTLPGKIDIALTGTDSAHRLNVESSSDGVHFGNKVTRPETSDAAPALAARQALHRLDGDRFRSPPQHRAVDAATQTISTTQLQWDLAGLGYLSWSGIDGIYGPVTTAAVRSFQSDAGITVDGIAGPQTDGALSTVIKEVQAKVGATQDGFYGPQTKADVEKYQRAHGLSVDGQAGPSTRRVMGITLLNHNGGGGGTPGESTNFDWARGVLHDLNAPQTSNNITVITQWMDSEEPVYDWWDRNNPLNNGLGSGGGEGLGSYSNLLVAAHYVALNLEDGTADYGAIVADLKASAAPSTTARAIWDSPWAASHYGYGSAWHSGSVATVAAPRSAW